MNGRGSGNTMGVGGDNYGEEQRHNSRKTTTSTSRNHNERLYASTIGTRQHVSVTTSSSENSKECMNEEEIEFYESSPLTTTTKSDSTSVFDNPFYALPPAPFSPTAVVEEGSENEEESRRYSSSRRRDSGVRNNTENYVAENPRQDAEVNFSQVRESPRRQSGLFNSSVLLSLADAEAVDMEVSATIYSSVAMSPTRSPSAKRRALRHGSLSSSTRHSNTSSPPPPPPPLTFSQPSSITPSPPTPPPINPAPSREEEMAISSSAVDLSCVAIDETPPPAITMKPNPRVPRWLRGMSRKKKSSSPSSTSPQPNQPQQSNHSQQPNQPQQQPQQQPQTPQKQQFKSVRAFSRKLLGHSQNSQQSVSTESSEVLPPAPTSRARSEFRLRSIIKQKSMDSRQKERLQHSDVDKSSSFDSLDDKPAPERRRGSALVKSTRNMVAARLSKGISLRTKTKQPPPTPPPQQQKPQQKPPPSPPQQQPLPPIQQQHQPQLQLHLPEVKCEQQVGYQEAQKRPAAAPAAVMEARNTTYPLKREDDEDVSTSQYSPLRESARASPTREKPFHPSETATASPNQIIRNDPMVPPSPRRMDSPRRSLSPSIKRTPEEIPSGRFPDIMRGRADAGLPIPPVVLRARSPRATIREEMQDANSQSQEVVTSPSRIARGKLSDSMTSHNSSTRSDSSTTGVVSSSKIRGFNRPTEWNRADSLRSLDLSHMEIDVPPPPPSTQRPSPRISPWTRKRNYHGSGELLRPEEEQEKEIVQLAIELSIRDHSTSSGRDSSNGIIQEYAPHEQPKSQSQQHQNRPEQHPLQQSREQQQPDLHHRGSLQRGLALFRSTRVLTSAQRQMMVQTRTRPSLRRIQSARSLDRGNLLQRLQGDTDSVPLSSYRNDRKNRLDNSRHSLRSSLHRGDSVRSMNSHSSGRDQVVEVARQALSRDEAQLVEQVLNHEHRGTSDLRREDRQYGRINNERDSGRTSLCDYLESPSSRVSRVSEEFVIVSNPNASDFTASSNQSHQLSNHPPQQEDGALLLTEREQLQIALCESETAAKDAEQAELLQLQQALTESELSVHQTQYVQSDQNLIEYMETSMSNNTSARLSYAAVAAGSTEQAPRSAESDLAAAAEFLSKEELELIKQALTESNNQESQNLPSSHEENGREISGSATLSASDYESSSITHVEGGLTEGRNVDAGISEEETAAIERAIREADAVEEAQSLQLALRIQEEEERLRQQSLTTSSVQTGNVRTMTRAELRAEATANVGAYTDFNPPPRHPLEQEYADGGSSRPYDYDEDRELELEAPAGFRMNSSTQHQWSRLDQNSIVGPGREVRTKHDGILDSQANVHRLGLDSEGSKIGNRTFNSFRQSMKRNTKKGVASHGTGRAGSDSDGTKGGALDAASLEQINRAINVGWINKLNGVVKEGKEAVIYHADKGQESGDFDVAVKIFKRIQEFRNRGEYVDGDPRFDGASFKNANKRQQLTLWTEKEYRNLMRANRSGVPVPTPLMYKENILMMRFLGMQGWPAPQLRELELRKKSKIWRILYQQVMEAIRTLYVSAKLVHGDLSEYNIMVVPAFLVENMDPIIQDPNSELQAVLIDFGQAVDHRHPEAASLLRRDLERVSSFFSRQEVTIMSPNEARLFVTGDERRLSLSNSPK